MAKDPPYISGRFKRTELKTWGQGLTSKRPRIKWRVFFLEESLFIEINQNFFLHQIF